MNGFKNGKGLENKCPCKVIPKRARLELFDVRFARFASQSFEPVIILYFVLPMPLDVKMKIVHFFGQDEAASAPILALVRHNATVVLLRHVTSESHRKHDQADFLSCRQPYHFSSA